MKKYIFILFLALVASQAFAKKDKIDKDAKIDSLTKANIALTSNRDSLSKDLDKYLGVYKAVKEKVMKRDFDPSTMSNIIDSLSKGREAAFAGITASTAYLKDSIVVLRTEITRMKSMIEGITNKEASNNRLVVELKQLKELLDSHTITQGDYETKKTVILQRWQ